MPFDPTTIDAEENPHEAMERALAAVSRLADEIQAIIDDQIVHHAAVPVATTVLDFTMASAACAALAAACDRGFVRRVSVRRHEA